MRASNEERIHLAEEKTSKMRWIIPVFLILLAAIGGYFYLQLDQQEEKTVPFTGTAPGFETDSETPPPRIPVIEVEEPNFILPSLNESDGVFRTRLINISEQLAPWLQSDELIRRGIAFNDSLTRGQVSTKLISLPAPQGKFKTVSGEDGLFISPENFQRYDYIVNIIRSVDVERFNHVFHLFRPLLEKAYGELGHDPSNLGSALVYNLDQILATPVIEDPVELELKSVYFTYADPALEKLSPVQKQLIRMGPEATRMIQEKASYLRDTLVNPEPIDSESGEDVEAEPNTVIEEGA